MVCTSLLVRQVVVVGLVTPSPLPEVLVQPPLVARVRSLAKVSVLTTSP
jgi:hypothetical protein